MQNRHPPSKLFSWNVRAERLSRHWSQAELAERVSDFLGTTLHQTTVAKIESGSRSVSVDEAAAFAIALDVPIDRMLYEEALDWTQYTLDSIQREIETAQESLGEAEAALMEKMELERQKLEELRDVQSTVRVERETVERATVHLDALMAVRKRHLKELKDDGEHPEA